MVRPWRRTRLPRIGHSGSFFRQSAVLVQIRSVSWKPPGAKPATPPARPPPGKQLGQHLRCRNHYSSVFSRMLSSVITAFWWDAAIAWSRVCAAAASWAACCCESATSVDVLVASGCARAYELSITFQSTSATQPSAGECRTMAAILMSSPSYKMMCIPSQSPRFIAARSSCVPLVFSRTRPFLSALLKSAKIRGTSLSAISRPPCAIVVVSLSLIL